MRVAVYAAMGRAYIFINVQSLMQTSRPLTIDHATPGIVDCRLSYSLVLGIVVFVGLERCNSNHNGPRQSRFRAILVFRGVVVGVAKANQKETTTQLFRI